MFCTVVNLTKQLIDAISADPIDRASMEAVGAALARLCNAKEEVLGSTQELIAHHLLRLSATGAFAFQPHLVTLLSELSVGFMRQARVEFMLPQDEPLPEPTTAVVQEPDKPQANMLLSLPIVLFTTDRSGIITFAEGQGLQRLGIPSDQLVGQPVSHICHTFFPQDAEGILCHVQRALDGETLHNVGTAGHVVFDMHYEPIRDEQGAITGITGVALDITEQTRAQSELADARLRLAESNELHQLRLAVEKLTQATPVSTTNISLSEREINLMRLVVAGKTNRSISRELEISERTVGNTLRTIFEKVGVNSRAEAIHRLVELGLRGCLILIFGYHHMTCSRDFRILPGAYGLFCRFHEGQERMTPKGECLIEHEPPIAR